MSKPAPFLCALCGLCVNKLPNIGPKPSRPQFRAEAAENAEAQRRREGARRNKVTPAPISPILPFMTTLEITLSDDVARKAAAAGLLTQAEMDDMLRARLRKDAGERLRVMMAQMQAVDDGQPPMSPEDVAEEIRIMRAERRKVAGH